MKKYCLWPLCLFWRSAPWIVALTSVLLIGCGQKAPPASGAGPGDSSVDGTVNTPVDSSDTSEEDGSGGEQKDTLFWGDLSCQKNESCQTDVLNYELATIIQVLERIFVDPELYGFDEYPDEEEAQVFACGLYIVTQWSQILPSATVAGEGIHSFVELTKQVVSRQNCELTENYQKRIQDFFENTKEYEDEVQ